MVIRQIQFPSGFKFLDMILIVRDFFEILETFTFQHGSDFLAWGQFCIRNWKFRWPFRFCGKRSQNRKFLSGHFALWVLLAETGSAIFHQFETQHWCGSKACSKGTNFLCKLDLFRSVVCWWIYHDMHFCKILKLTFCIEFEAKVGSSLMALGYLFVITFLVVNPDLLRNTFS